MLELATGSDVRDALADLVFELIGLDRASAHGGTAGAGHRCHMRAAPGGGLLVGNGDVRVLFYGRDVAFEDGDDRIHHEFVRDGGRVRWMRINGQVAAKEG